MTWRDRAVCRGCDPDLFFPERGESCFEAKLVCSHCPVQAECLEAGLMESVGVWGGKSERERRVLRLQRGPVERSCSECGTVFWTKQVTRHFTCGAKCQRARTWRIKAQRKADGGIG